MPGAGGAVPARKPPPAVVGHVAVGLGKAAFAVLAAGPALLVGGWVDEAEPLGLHDASRLEDSRRSPRFGKSI